VLVIVVVVNEYLMMEDWLLVVELSRMKFSLSLLLLTHLCCHRNGALYPKIHPSFSVNSYGGWGVGE
jgi:hypothetical protein